MNIARKSTNTENCGLATATKSSADEIVHLVQAAMQFGNVEVLSLLPNGLITMVAKVPGLKILNIW